MLQNDKAKLTLPSPEYLASLDKVGLEKQAKETSERILTQLKRIAEKIKDAEKLAFEAENFKNRSKLTKAKEFFGIDKSGDKKHLDLLTKANRANTDAIAEQSKIIEECIRFTQISSDFSKAMNAVMAHMVVKGFESSDGKHIILSESARAMAEHIIQESERFVENEERNRQTIDSLERDLDEVEDDIDKIEQNIDEVEKDIDEIEKNIDEVEANVDNLEKNIDEVEEDIDKIEQNIDEVEKEVDELQESDALQKEQIAANTEAIKKLEAKTQSKISLYTSIFALLVSLASLALHFI